ncbi:adenylate/guanylate cyclase domain-containing protein [Herpetosiphon gulosus]|uniref:Adenylate cyclase n=1 Tax=Herpetosiphon gulosus TaxID=1973496 RepID=A0ABP9WZV7_9CHLR
MARLLATIDGQSLNIPITSRGLQIGRSRQNDIVLNHPHVSRHHASLETRGRDIFVRDTGSSNGTFVNGLRVKEAALRANDLISIGPFELKFDDRAAASVIISDEELVPLQSNSRSVSSGKLPELNLDANDILQNFYQVSSRLNMILDLGELLDTIMDEVLRLVPAERGLLLMTRQDGLVPMVVRAPSETQSLTISSTIARRVLREGVALLTSDARVEFGSQDSIISQNIHSVLCVPLIGRAGVLGLVHLDSPGLERFSIRDRELLTAVAYQASLGIERANLTDQIRNEEKLRQQYARFLSPDVARTVAQQINETGEIFMKPVEQDASVLFSDIQGFTTMTETLPPLELQNLLNEYLSVMTDVIFEHGGTLDKFIGDGIMALFGAPVYYEDHAQRAIDTALDMLVQHQKLMAKIDASKHFRIRIGVNTGRVISGLVGTRERLEYTVHGDTVNTASRLEGKAEPNSVYTSEATIAQLGESYQVQEVGPLQLKGKALTVQVFRVMGKNLPSEGFEG